MTCTRSHVINGARSAALASARMLLFPPDSRQARSCCNITQIQYPTPHLALWPQLLYVRLKAILRPGANMADVSLGLTCFHGLLCQSNCGRRKRSNFLCDPQGLIDDVFVSCDHLVHDSETFHLIRGCWGAGQYKLHGLPVQAACQICDHCAEQ